jgi:hypothetical protein
MWDYSSSRTFSEFPKSFNIGVVPWGSAIQKFEKRSLDLDGSTKSKTKAGHSGKDLSIACNAARFAGPRSKIKIERLNVRNRLSSPITVKPHRAGSLQRLDGVSHVKNFQIVAFDELEPLAKLLVADFAFCSLSQEADHPGDAYVRRCATKFLELESRLRKQSF